MDRIENQFKTNHPVFKREIKRNKNISDLSKELNDKK